MTTEAPRNPFGLPVFASGLAVVGAAAAGGAELATTGLSPLAASALAATTAGALTVFGLRGLARSLARRAADATRELEAGRTRAEGREELLRAVVEATPLALLFYSDSGHIIHANAEARRLFFEGSSPEGQNFLRLIADAPEALRRALLGDTDELFTAEVDGQQETYHVSRRNIFFDGETHTLLLVRHLTFEISRREVDVLKKVIRIISHELNNSLAPIGSLVHSARVIAKNPAHLPKLDVVFDTIEERAVHLREFLNGYANLARLPKPRVGKVAWEPILLRLRALYPEARIADMGTAKGYFDAAQIEQLLINLLKNANEAGGAASDVVLSVVPGAEGSATIELSDRGKGLTSEALESAFLPLYSTKEGGSGMGLALCREVVEAHGGRTSIKNREGGGCTVSCFLPGEKRTGDDGNASRATLTLTRS